MVLPLIGAFVAFMIHAGGAGGAVGAGAAHSGLAAVVTHTQGMLHIHAANLVQHAGDKVAHHAVKNLVGELTKDMNDQDRAVLQNASNHVMSQMNGDSVWSQGDWGQYLHEMSQIPGVASLVSGF